jgi:hypothetical protein
LKLSKSTFLIATAIVFHVAAVAAAQSPETPKSSSVKLGDKLIVIPNPEGFEEASSQFEKVRQALARMETPGSDSLLLYMPTSDCERVRNGSRPEITLKPFCVSSGPG